MGRAKVQKCGKEGREERLDDNELNVALLLPPFMTFWLTPLLPTPSSCTRSLSHSPPYLPLLSRKYPPFLSRQSYEVSCVGKISFEFSSILADTLKYSLKYEVQMHQRSVTLTFTLGHMGSIFRRLL